MLHSSQHQTIPPNKSHIEKSMKINHQSFNSRPVENYYFQAGILQTPHPFFYHSYPPYCLPQSQPPIFHKKNSSFPKKSNFKTNDLSETQATRKSKINSSSKSPKKGGTMMKTTKKVARVSPEPKNNLPKEDVPNKMMVSTTIPSKDTNFSKTIGKSLKSNIDNQVDKILSSVIFTISPPPSSLPLPTFSLRPKLSCMAQAANVDSGATGDLRRLLRLQ